MDRLDEIKHLYLNAKPATIARDLARAIALLKEMPSEQQRERAAVFMDGLSQMRSEWALERKARDGGPAPRAKTPGR